MSDESIRTPISIVIAHYNLMSCELIAKALEQRESYKVVARVVSASALIDSVASAKPDIALTSSRLQDGNTAGLTAVQGIHRSNPSVRSIVLLDTSDQQVTVDAFRAGTKGIFCPSRNSFEMLCRCVRQVHAGQVWATAEELSYVMEAFASHASPGMPSAELREVLTPREQEVVSLIVAGLTNKEIAMELALSEHTIKNYLFRIFEKLGVSSRVQVVSHMTGMVSRPRIICMREPHTDRTSCADGLYCSATEPVGAA